MKNKQEVRIELTKQSHVDLLNLGGYCLVDLEHLPFNEFTIVHPSVDKDDVSYEDVERLCGKFNMEVGSAFRNEKEKEIFIKNMMKDMLSTRTEIDVCVVGRDVKVSEGKNWTIVATMKDYVFDGRDVENFSELFEDIEFNAEDESVIGAFGEDMDFTKSILTNVNVVFGLISFLQSESEKIVKRTSKIDVVTKKNKKGKTSSKTYIYKKRYVFEDDTVRDIKQYRDESTRKYERKVESWFSRGYWRTSKNGVVHWVNKSIKKAKTAVSNIAEYKITKTK